MRLLNVDLKYHHDFMFEMGKCHVDLSIFGNISCVEDM